MVPDSNGDLLEITDVWKLSTLSMGYPISLIYDFAHYS